MARFGAPLVALVCSSMVVGLLATSAIAQEADDAPPPASSKQRKRVPIVRTRAETIEGDVPVRNEPEEPTEGGEQKPKRIPRGEVPVMRLAPITAAMLKVLQEWEVQSAKVTELYGDFSRITYEWTFNTQKEAKGRFAYKAPDKGAFKLINVAFPPGTPGFEKTDSQNKKVQFVRAESKPEHWICTGAELYNIDHPNKTYEVLVIPPENRGQGIMETPLPFLFGMKVQQARSRYLMKFAKDPQKTPGVIWLSVKPLWQKDSVNYKEATVILDSTTFLPIAVQLIDPPGTTETVYKFSNLTQKPSWIGRDPFKERPPQAYKRVQAAQGKAEPKGARR